MKQKYPTVTVAISAYNEEKNILRFLKSIILQKEIGFKIKEIWVHSDGSTDKTVALARSIKSKKIKVWDHKKRTGKSTWLNKIYKDLKTDILVQSDADVVFAHNLVVHDLIKPLIKNPKVGMCGGNPMPVEGKTYWEKVVRVAFEPYQEFRSSVRGGNNAFSAIGQLLAYRKSLVKKIIVPEDMITNDIFTYFYCLQLGWEYRYVKSAIVLFQSPQRLRDLLRQNTRFHAGYNRMFNYFPAELVKEEFKIPKLIYIYSLFKQFVKHPIFSGTYYLINIYCLIKASRMGDKLTARWPIALTTKKLRFNQI
ncbi:hypothetical protein A2697_00565 [Candidatus Curtissbacteria bacterium RIFCSPHIGHO2_01_FULL_41_44]|uniref:Glycosyltransferase 2-like domain-containing protein n=1 Tax=Candidatus Curtissbacteria bacterium RIFCSPLOWO2_01_FULL_42_50 TaxID=1797730 RepID=A0A1F5H5G7_9BACT|nr:MAG: hypothetical protein A2697_00565 [Candidatus Curtissbacteria bacterium RIFCSPHIGHO2_01_FULL_41_44]OGD96715.1 MAG: hypothetical protein A3E71_01290 [Candidatus Curtissbacteria bacterium RIFCSPHIGHO2_12_FULL_42_33]OGD99370.1 MAG: hypothetical protein A3B54_04520 [Candidatus Curtissbacteria bacterium RIFCSPLOWO2_01_FULL_42_50]OGE02415.1 MAG: hypothetical protein A3G16_05225 [Candidatus Curtissbacteria bacterium RIFCSPLOWO2_12_FULL_41_16]